MRKDLGSVMVGFFIAVVLGLTGCGGGGAPSTPTPTGTAVSMAPINGVLLGTSAGATLNFPSLVGSDLQGRGWSGSSQTIADGVTTFEGRTVNRVRTLITLQLAGGTPVSGISTQYFLAANSSYYKVVDSSGTAYVPTSQTAIPSTMNVGDFGTIGTFTGSEGTTITMTWALTAGVNGASTLAISSVIKTGTTVTATEVDSYHLDAAGVPTSISIIVTAAGTTVTLSGNKG